MTHARENILWNYLDTLNIKFRVSKSSLISEYGSRNCGWTENLDVCEIMGKRPFIEGLFSPIFFQFDPRRDQSPPPATLQAYVRETEDAQLNFDITIEKLGRIFGEGQDCSNSNTRAQIWRFSDAVMRATIFPPHLNPSHNSRHDIIKGSATECSLQIITGYRPPISQVQLRLLRSSPDFEKIAEGAIVRPIEIPSRTQKRVPDLPSSRIGGLSLDNGRKFFFYLNSRKYVEIVPVKWLQSLQYICLTPARGPGGIYLYLNYYPEGNSYLSQYSLRLIDAKFEPGAYLELARRLSKTLSIPLLMDEQEDC